MFRWCPTRLCLGDLGYLGAGKHGRGIDTPLRKPRKRALTRQERRANRKQRRIRVKVEHSIRRLKVFRIVSSVYRNRRKRFGLRLNLIAALVNRDLPKHNQKHL